MKKINYLFILLMLPGYSFGQTNYYTLNIGNTIYETDSIKAIYYTLNKRMPNDYKIVPIIYHKVVRNDSIINYLLFNQVKVEKRSEETKFELTFVQDSLFLLLDKKLPDFKLIDTNGKGLSSSQLYGKPTLINFWATWCAPCVAEIPDLNELKNRYGNEMNFIAITTEIPTDKMKLFLERRKFNFIILFDQLQNFNNSMMIHGIPRNVFIDKEGFIKYIKAGYNPLYYQDSDEFICIIEELINKR